MWSFFESWLPNSLHSIIRLVDILLTYFHFMSLLEISLPYLPKYHGLFHWNVWFSQHFSNQTQVSTYEIESVSIVFTVYSVLLTWFACLFEALEVTSFPFECTYTAISFIERLPPIFLLPILFYSLVSYWLTCASNILQFSGVTV